MLDRSPRPTTTTSESKTPTRYSSEPPLRRKPPIWRHGRRTNEFQVARPGQLGRTGDSSVQHSSKIHINISLNCPLRESDPIGRIPSYGHKLPDRHFLNLIIIVQLITEFPLSFHPIGQNHIIEDSKSVLKNLLN